MESNTHLIDPLMEKATVYTQTTLALWKLQAIEKISLLCATLISNTLVVLVLSVSLLFLSLALALYLGDCLGKMYQGFLLVSAIYILLTIVFLSTKKMMKKRLIDIVIDDLHN